MNRWVLVGFCLLLAEHLQSRSAQSQQPPAIDPFGKRREVREDAVPGYAQLSDKTVYPGRLYLTRDARLRILDDQTQRRHEVPLSAVQRIDCEVQREWMEKEWRFREAANDEKVYTGRTYPARQYLHRITLRDGRTVQGALSAIVYVQGSDSEQAERLLLHKRQKGDINASLKSLVYVQTIELGDKALEKGRQLAATPKAREKDPIR